MCSRHRPWRSEEIFGPVLVAMTFRTPDEAVMLANNTRYGLAASVWSETIGLALDIAPKLAGRRGLGEFHQSLRCQRRLRRLSRIGLRPRRRTRRRYEYLKPKAWAERKAGVRRCVPLPVAQSISALPLIDRTAKLFIGGKQARPDGNYSRPVVVAARASVLGEVGEGNRKDIRNAVAAARAAEAWSQATPHNRAQILYYIAENLSGRREEFAARIAAMTGAGRQGRRAKSMPSIARLFTYGAWADKYEGDIHAPPLRGVALAMKEPIGVAGVVCPDEAPLLGFLSLVAPLIAMGNRVVAVPSERHPLAATDFYSVLETSDVPAGCRQYRHRDQCDLLKTLAEHDDVDALWVFGSEAIVGGSREAVGRQSQAHAGRSRPRHRLV